MHETASNLHRLGGEHREGGDEGRAVLRVHGRREHHVADRAGHQGGVIGLLAVFWPLMLGQKASGGWHPWVWAIAIPWWILLALAGIGYLISKAEERKQARGARAPSGR